MPDGGYFGLENREPVWESEVPAEDLPFALVYDESRAYVVSESAAVRVNVEQCERAVLGMAIEAISVYFEADAPFGRGAAISVGEVQPVVRGYPFPVPEVTDSVGFAGGCAWPVDFNDVVEPAHCGESFLLAEEVQGHYIQYHLLGGHWGGFREAAKGIDGHSVDSSQSGCGEWCSVAPDHGSVTQHGAHDAEVCPPHKCRFWSPLVSCDACDVELLSSVTPRYFTSFFVCDFFAVDFEGCLWEFVSARKHDRDQFL